MAYVVNAKCSAWLLALLVPLALRAADADPSSSLENPENFKIEITGSGWIVNTSGTVQSEGEPVNLVTDLGAQQQQPTFFGRFVFKPSRRQRIVVEGFPFSVNGYNVVRNYGQQVGDARTTSRGRRFPCLSRASP